MRNFKVFTGYDNKSYFIKDIISDGKEVYLLSNGEISDIDNRPMNEKLYYFKSKEDAEKVIKQYYEKESESSMKFWEAMKALQEGKKVRKKNWCSSWFVFIKGNTAYLHIDSSEIDCEWKDCIFEIIDDEDWEIYKQPLVKFKDVPLGGYFRFADCEDTFGWKVDKTNHTNVIIYFNGLLTEGLNNNDTMVVYPVSIGDGPKSN